MSVGLLVGLGLLAGAVIVNSLAKEESDYDGKFTADEITDVPAVINAVKGEDIREEKGYNIQDTTSQNIEQVINSQNTTDILNMMKQQQENQWKKQEEWRKEDQQRQDTAYQRAVQDMQKAGINPNLMNVTPAQSQSGTATPAEQDNSIFSTYMQAKLEEIDRAYQEGKVDTQDYKNLASAIKDIMIITQLLFITVKMVRHKKWDFLDFQTLL